MDENNFKKVDDFEASEELKGKSLKNTEGNVSTVKAFFNVLDLYISKIFDTFIHSLKDESNNHINGFAAGMKGYGEDEKDEDEKDESKDDKNIK